MGGRGRVRAREHDSGPGRSPVARRAAADAGRGHPVEQLQRSAGNAAVAGLVQREEEGGGGIPIKEWWSDLKKHFSHDDEKKKEGEDEGGEWTEPSEEVALHSKQALWAAGQAAEYLRRQAMRAGDSEGMERAAEAAEKFKKGGELLEAGEKGFKTLVKLEKLREDAPRLMKLAEDFQTVDPYKDPHAAAEMFDELFGTAGEFAGDIAPEGPWKGYFDFLKGFKQYKFFQHMGAAFENERKRAEDAANGDRPAQQPQDQAPVPMDVPSLPADAPVDFENLWSDILGKIEKNVALGGSKAALDRPKEELRTALNELESDRKALLAMHFWEGKDEAKEKLGREFTQVLIALGNLDTQFTMIQADRVLDRSSRGLPPNVSLKPDIAAVEGERKKLLGY